MEELSQEEIKHMETFFDRNALIGANPRYEARTTHLHLAENMRYQKWLNIGQSLASLGKSLNFWIGDWLVFGTKHYGEKFSQGAAELEIINDKLTPKTLEQYTYVARRYKPDQRVTGLSWRHHQIVSGADPEIRAELLNKALEHNMTTRELSDTYKVYRNALKPDEVYNEPNYQCPSCGHVFRRSQLNEILTDSSELS